jgi:hypothetical protein
VIVVNAENCAFDRISREFASSQDYLFCAAIDLEKFESLVVDKGAIAKNQIVHILDVYDAVGALPYFCVYYSPRQ